MISYINTHTQTLTLGYFGHQTADGHVGVWPDTPSLIIGTVPRDFASKWTFSSRSMITQYTSIWQMVVILHDLSRSMLPWQPPIALDQVGQSITEGTWKHHFDRHYKPNGVIFSHNDSVLCVTDTDNFTLLVFEGKQIINHYLHVNKPKEHF